MMQTKTTRRLLMTVVVLQALTLLGQWVTPSYTRPAAAQIPDAGAQRFQMVDELRAMNSKMDKLIGILESGKLQVHAATPDDRKDGK